jgi:hypothetical protein
MTVHIEQKTLDVLANGLGSLSLFCLVLAGKRIIPATVSVTADTGSENDRLWSNGKRSTAREYFDEVVEPYARKHGIDARFVRAVDKNKRDLPSLEDATEAIIDIGKFNSLSIPLYGSRGGQRNQSCTDKWKIRAIRQEARRMGATRLITAQGIHAGEIGRRKKGIRIGVYGEWTLYQDTIMRKCDGEKVEVPVKWCQHYYPLADRGYSRATAQNVLMEEDIPYLISTECDFCPHQDIQRWDRHTPEKLVQIAAMEAKLRGSFFFTNQRVPLPEALARMRLKPSSTLETNFGCGNAYCGI